MISAKNLWVKVLFEVSPVKLKDALDRFLLSIANNENGEGQLELTNFSESNGNFSCIILYRFKSVKPDPKPEVKSAELNRVPDLADILDGVPSDKLEEKKLAEVKEVKKLKK